MKILLVCLSSLLLLMSCSTVTLKPTDFSWAVENVVKSDVNGQVKGEPRTLACNVKPLLWAEFQDSTNVDGKEIRIIRDRAGFYYLTSSGFKNVYILKGGDESLILHKKVLVDQNGVASPAFNRRDKGIELLSNQKSIMLNKNGIVEEK